MVIVNLRNPNAKHDLLPLYIDCYKNYTATNWRNLLYKNVKQKEDIKRLDTLLNEIQDKKNFINILQYTLKGMGVHVFIGSNTKVFNLAGCSMIIAPLKRSGKSIKPNTLGAIGVIGPSRLNYARIIPMVDFTAKVLNKFLS